MKNKWLYLSGVGWNGFGDGLQAIVMTSWVYLTTGSAFWVGCMIAVTYLPALVFAPWAGVWADYRDAKRLAVWTDVARALVVVIMAVLMATGSFSLVVFYALQLLLAFGNMLFKPASQALIKETFLEQDLVFALTKSSTVSEGMLLIGSGVGGWLAALVKPELFLLINAGTFALSAACNAGLQRVAVRTPAKQKVKLWQELASGWTFLRDTQGMLYLLGLSVVSSWSMQMCTTLLAPLVYDTLQGGKGMFSTMDIVFTVGGALAGLLVKPALSRFGPWAGVSTMVGMGCCSALLGWFGKVPGIAAVLLFGIGFFTMFHMVMMQTLIQINTPTELIGRVVGLRSILASSTKISAALLSGWMVNMVGLSQVYLGFAVAVGLVLLTSRHIRSIPMPSYLREGKKRSVA